jgi:two-component system, OmpR family, sensor histidine kinase BaeS
VTSRAREDRSPSRSSGSRRRAGRRAAPGLAARLLGAQLVVVVAGSLTLALVAMSVAPRFFTVHLDHAGETDPVVRSHAEEAFSYSLAISLTVAGAVSVGTALVVSALVVRRLTTPVIVLAAAADQLAAGNYRVDVPEAHLGEEFDRLTGAFTRMGDRLAGTEQVRRRLLSDLAHELRTPLGTLAVHVDGLEDGVVPASDATWQTMRDQLERLQRLAGDLSQLSAAEEHALPLDLQPVDLTEVATASVEAARPRFQAKGVTLAQDPSDAVLVMGDPVRLQQVLGNLLDNALRHTPQTGTVRVRPRAHERSGSVEVQDDGVGIPVQELEAVFSRFHRVDSARARADGGSGLGLTIARAITTAHHGSLTATSAGPGTGSTFTLRIPLANVQDAGQRTARSAQ